MKKHRKWMAAMVIGLCSGALAAALEAGRSLDALEGLTWNLRMRAVARPSPCTPRIKVVLLDQYSLQWAAREMGWSWPWPREAYGAILGFCQSAGAASVGFDMIFTEPSYMGVADDAALGEAIADTTGFVGAVMLTDEAEVGVDRWPEGVSLPEKTFPGFEAWQAAAAPSARPSRAIFPIPEVTTNAFRLGDVRGLPDEDGVFRRIPILRSFHGVPVWPLGIAMARAAKAASERTEPVSLGPSTLNIGARAISLDPDGAAVLRYRGPSGTHPTFTAASVIQSYLILNDGGTPPLDPAEFKDAHVLLGASAPALMDLRTSPMSKVYPGVEVHATALDNWLEGDFVRRPTRSMRGLLAAFPAVLAALLVVLPKRASTSGVWLALALAAVVGGAYAAANEGHWVPMAAALAGVLTSGAAGLLFNYATEGRQKAFVKQAFRHYLGPEVIEQIIEDPGRLKLGGEKRDLTIFFSDIEGFSTFSERLDPPVLTALLNEYLTEMSRIILEEGGYLDKYIGDAVVAFWNAPLIQPDHALRGLRAALRCQRRLTERRAEWAERYGAEIRARVALRRGCVRVGNMGSDERFNYPSLGDPA
ncbi:MAG: adenylate/guanylate cyclase domain-containing protein, partial [Kiritimatiellae bacterium]|nr:adenylate/guanylate cyclase domain-containing protein [Kiritimatiellia bacterium]